MDPTLNDTHILFSRVRKEFTLARQRVVAVEDLSVSIKRGEVVSIVGKTGCGKSTAFNMLLGLEPPTSGALLVDGREPHKDFEFFRSKFGVIFQSDRLLDWRTALSNTVIGLEVLRRDPQEMEATGRRWLREVGLEGFEDAYPYQLSGGMRQRVAIARAFSVDPEILLCDEAFGHLDEITGEKLRQIFRRLVEETGKTALVITHDILEALQLGHRIIVLGRPARVLYEAPIPSFHSLEERQAFEGKIFQIIDRNEPVA
jgi:NitT/TauT family transport system ATP-binding protein